MKKHWLYYITPCILASLVCVFGLFIGLTSLWKEEDDGDFIRIFAGAGLTILLITDHLVKALTKGNVRNLWIIEIIILVTTGLWFRFYLL